MNPEQNLGQQKSENHEEKSLMSRDFKGIWLPRDIWLRKDISLMAKCIWAEIDSLHSEEHGGCYASDSYLMEFAGLKRAMLQRYLQELKLKGLIKVIKNDGTIRVILAVHKTKENIHEPLSTDRHPLSTKVDTPCLQKWTPKSQEFSQEGDISIEQSKKELSKESSKEPETSSPPSPNRPPIHKEQKKKLTEVVELTERQLQDLYQVFGKKKVDEEILQMTDYCLSHGKKYKDYSAALRKWMRNEKFSPQRDNFNSIEYAREIESQFLKAGSKDVTITHKGIIFRIGGQSGDQIFEFNDKLFKQRLDIFLSKPYYKKLLGK